MNKRLIILTCFILLAITFPAFALETRVETSGSERLTEIQESLQTTIKTRITARGYSAPPDASLDIQITQLGSIISFDAILKTNPPQAFHKDLKSLDEISPAIDEMLNNLLASPTISSQPTDIRPVAHKNLNKQTIELTKDICSITCMQENIYLADNQAIYLLHGNNLQTWWNTSSSIDEIFRITAYKDTIIALINHGDEFISTQIKDGKIIKEWVGVVTPINDSLEKASIKLKPDLSYASNRWTTAETIEGNKINIPRNIDILATVAGDVYPKHAGNEIITLSSTGRLEMLDGKNVLWASDAKFNSLPLSIKETYYESKDEEVEEKEQHYYLQPRIIVHGQQFIIAQNSQGLLGILDNLKRFKSTQIISYGWTGVDMEQTVLASTSMGYCLDIAVQTDKLLSLIVMKKGRMLMVTSLK